MSDAAQITHGAKAPNDWTTPDGDVDCKLDELADRLSWTVSGIITSVESPYESSVREITRIDPSS